MQKNHVDRHERAHTGDKPYTCRHCGAAFVDRSGLNQHALSQHGEEPLRLTPAGVVARGSGRPRKPADGVEQLDQPVSVAKKVRVQEVVEVHVDEEEDVEDAELRSAADGAGREGGQAAPATKKAKAKRTAQKALWKAGLGPHPGGRPPKHRADVLVLSAPVSIVRTGRKRLPQALVDDLALLPTRPEQPRARGRPRKQEQLAMLRAGRPREDAGELGDSSELQDSSELNDSSELHDSGTGGESDGGLVAERGAQIVVEEL